MLQEKHTLCKIYFRLCPSPFIKKRKIGKIRAASLASMWSVRSNRCILSERCNRITPCSDDSLGPITTRFTDVVSDVLTVSHTLYGKSAHVRICFHVRVICFTLPLSLNTYWCVPAPHMQLHSWSELVQETVHLRHKIEQNKPLDNRFVPLYQKEMICSLLLFSQPEHRSTMRTSKTAQMLCIHSVSFSFT